jgi:hypothetical protein
LDRILRFCFSIAHGFVTQQYHGMVSMRNAPVDDPSDHAVRGIADLRMPAWSPKPILVAISVIGLLLLAWTAIAAA